MKNKILGLLLVVVLLGVTGCGNKVTIDKVIEKFNNSETVKKYKEYNYILNASKDNDKLVLTSTMGEDKKELVFKIDGNIISNDNIASEDIMLLVTLIDSVGQVHGYSDGELAKNMNAFGEEVQKYTLDKEGMEIKFLEDKVSLKIDISKKIPLIDMNNYYLKTTDLDIISEIIKDKQTGNQSGKTGNIAYDVFVGGDYSTIKIGQDEKLGDSAYKSLLSAIEVIYGSDVSNHFKEIYPKFVDGKKEIEAFTIETDYKEEDDAESVFKDTKVVMVNIDNSKLK